MSSRGFGGWPSPIFLAGSALVAQMPNSLASGGNARGANATDWQASRSAAGQVAAGAQSSIGGGEDNTASGTASTVGGGSGNSAVSGAGWVPGGRDGRARGIHSGAWGGGAFASQGDAQAGEYLLRRITTDATATRLTADNAAPGTFNTVNLPNNSAYVMRVEVVAFQTAGAGSPAAAGWVFDFLLFRGANAASTFTGGGITAAAPTWGGLGGSAWRITVDADQTNGGLLLSVTGEAGKTIRWVARIISVEATA